MVDYDTKVLCVKKIGWKRIAKNTQKFGWELSDAEEETTFTTETEYENIEYDNKVYTRESGSTTTSKTRIWLYFHRYKSTIKNCNSIKVLEAFYNFIFLIRRILAFILPIMTIGIFFVIVLGSFIENFFNIKDFYLYYLMAYFIGLFVWIAMIITENILANIARDKILNL
jgi:hypothetical protein